MYRLCCGSVIIVVLASAGCSSKPLSDEEAKKILKQKVELAAKAVMEGQFEVLIELSHPEVIKAFGGRDKMLEYCKSDARQAKAMSSVFEKFQVDEPTQFVNENDKMYGIVSYTLWERNPKRRVKSRTWMLGVSTDGGRNWHLVGGGTVENSKYYELIPDLPREIKLPAKEDVVLD